MADQAMRACLHVATAGVALGRSGHARETLEGEEEEEEEEEEEAEEEDEEEEEELPPPPPPPLLLLLLLLLLGGMADNGGGQRPPPKEEVGGAVECRRPRNGALRSGTERGIAVTGMGWAGVMAGARMT